MSILHVHWQQQAAAVNATSVEDSEEDLDAYEDALEEQDSDGAKSEIFAEWCIDDIDNSATDEQIESIVMAAMAEIQSIDPAMSLWDTGAQCGLKNSRKGFIGRIAESFKRLVGFNGKNTKPHGEGTHEVILETDEGSAHNLVTNEPLVEGAPINITSAPQCFSQGYGAIHNVQGTLTMKSGRVIELNKGEQGAFRKACRKTVHAKFLAQHPDLQDEYGAVKAKLQTLRGK